MSCFGNVLWFLFGGLLMGISWLAVGVLWCVTIVGIPVGLQCFKIAELSFSPFGREIVCGGGVGSFLLNLLWLVFGGLALAAEAAVIGLLLCVTVVGIPFGLQCFKLALMPFGASVV